MIIITGTSRGIGKSLAELYLEKGEKVIGIGRTSSIEHSGYSHLFCDLSDSGEVEKLQLPEIDGEIIFVHNAGVLGEIGRFSESKKSSHEEVMQVNFNSGVSIFHQLLGKSANNKFTCVFVSSGAGKRPIASWASYCASKAAVDLFLETVQAEENEKEHSTLQVYAFSPGVVDTAMQAKIRTVGEEVFSSIERFKRLHENGELASPDTVAQKLAQLIAERPDTKVQWSLSEID